MKKTFDSFAPCEELREVIFLRQLPTHPHLVPALDIFLDPFSKKLHIAMEYMDGNLYQLMKAREGKHLEGNVVKSILFVSPSDLFPHATSDRVSGTKSCPGWSTFMQMDSSIVTSSPKIFSFRQPRTILAREEDSEDIRP